MEKTITKNMKKILTIILFLQCTIGVGAQEFYSNEVNFIQIFSIKMFQ